MKTIVICADGTGNSFGAQVSNVSRLVQLIDLNHAEQQVACYDQGIGTDPRYVNAVNAYRDRERVQRRAWTSSIPRSRHGGFRPGSSAWSAWRSRFFKCGRTGARHPAQFSRQQMVRLHSSVGPRYDVATSSVGTRVASFPERERTSGT